MVEMVPKIVGSERFPLPAADLKSLHHVTACSDVDGSKSIILTICCHQADRRCDCFDQPICREWLKQIRDAAKIHGLPPVRFFLRPGHEYDGKLKAGRRKMLAQFHARNVTKLDVDNEARRLRRHRRTDKFFGRCIYFGAISKSGEQVL